MPGIRRCRSLARGVLLAAVLAACASSSGSGATSTSSTAPGAKGTVTVSAAASLTEAFQQLGDDFHAANPGATVTFNFGSTATLATQIQQGAPVDVFASADQANMTTLVHAQLVAGAPSEFARNQLVIVTPPGNPKGIRTLADLADADVVALCGETSPCGRYAAQVLAGADVTVPPDHITRGQDVKATLAAVTTGDADAAIVYATDAKAAGSTVTTVNVPEAQNAIAVYPIAVLNATGNPATANALVRFVISPAGERTLRSFGFRAPA